MKNIILSILYIFAVFTLVSAQKEKQKTVKAERKIEATHKHSGESYHSHEKHTHDNYDHSHAHNEKHSHDYNEEHSWNHDKHDDEHSHDHQKHEHKHSDNHTHNHSGEHNHANEIENLKTIKIIPKTFTKTIHTTGIIKVLPTNEAIITAKANGVVNFINNDIVVGQKVNQKSRLFSISGKGLIDNNIDVEFVKSRNDYKQSLENFNRAKSLIKEKIISQKEFLTRKSQFEANEIQYKTLQKNYNSKALQIKSPVEGEIFEIFVQNGDFVSAGQKLATISKNCENYLEIDLPKKYYKKIKHINSGRFKMEYSDELNEFVTGAKISHSSRIRSGSPFIPVNFSLGHNHDIIPGSFSEVWLDIEKVHNSVVIPREAIIEQQGLYFVFVKKSGGDFIKTQIDINSMNAEEAQIASGINVGDVVVVDGVLELKLTQSTSTIDPHAGHSH